MGCFLGCLRFREKDQPSRHQGNVPTVQNKEDTVSNNRTQSGRFNSSAKTVDGSPFLEDCLETRKSENLCVRNGSIKWDESLVKSADIRSAPETNTPSKHPISELIPPSTPPSVGKSRNPFEECENGNFNEEVNYLKACGAILKTPSEIRTTAKRQRSPPKDDANEKSDWHSWFPPPPDEGQWKTPPRDLPTPPSHLYRDLSGVLTQTSMVHVSEGLSTRFDEETLDIKGETNNEKQNDHLAGKDDEVVNDHGVVSTPQKSSIANEEIEYPTGVSPMSSKLLEPNQSRPSRYDQCSNTEEDSDSFSDGGSISSHDSTSKNENHIFKQFDLTPAFEPQTPPLFKSNFSPNPTPLIVTEDMQTPWTTRTRENAGLNKNARIRANYVHPVLNPVENLSQWKELKKGHAKDYEQDQFAGFQTPGSRGSPINSVTKENLQSEEEMKTRCDSLDVDECGQKRKYDSASSETFKTPKLSGESNQIPEDAQSPATSMDSTLFHWLKTPPVAQERSSPLETSTPISAVIHAHGLPKYKSIDDKPILGVVPVNHMQTISAERSPKSKACSDDDRPILGIVAAHWNENQNVSPKWFDGNGIPNSTNKYKEDQKVRLHTTPFEERIEKALSSQGVGGGRKLFDAKTTTTSEETEESDTAAS